MLSFCASYLADILLQKCSLDSSRKAVYVYGLELLISTLTSALSILIFSVLFSELRDGIILLLVFVGLRLFCGGYHAETYGRCFLSSNITFLAVLFFTIIISHTQNFAFIIVPTIFANFIILRFSPVHNPRHPLSNKAFQKNKRMGRLLLILIDLAVATGYFLDSSIWISSVISLSGTAVAVLILIPVLRERRMQNVKGLVCNRFPCRKHR